MVNKVKGTYDILSEDIKIWHFLEQKIKEVTKKYNYTEIRTPIMEYSNVFHRESEQSDMVLKETYNFKDKGNRDLTLRPEGTAGVIRSYVENKTYATSDLYKVYYVGPMFRYERPQKGRYRQFHQFGCEAIGYKNPLLDAEVIKLASDFVKAIGLKNVIVEVNSLGDSESRENYYKALKEYLIPFKDELSNDSKDRLERNPLRILDSKDKKDIEIVKNAPKPIDYLSKESKKYFEDTIKYLEIMDVKYSINNKLVRGLDYYSEVVFEILADLKNFGSQNALGGGGRYENLVNELGGPKTSAIGFSFGIDRLILAIKEEEIQLEDNDSLDAYVIMFSENELDYGLNIINELRSNNLLVDFDFKTRSFRNQLRRALNNNSKYLIIIGDNEKNNNLVTLKNTITEEEETINKDLLIDKLKEGLK